jgi:hypothetical protein
MAVDAIVRIGFQSSVLANQAANQALVGHTQNATGPGPLQRVNTAVFEVLMGADADVLKALQALNEVMVNHAGLVDFFSVSLTRHDVI